MEVTSKVIAKCIFKKKKKSEKKVIFGFHLLTLPHLCHSLWGNYRIFFNLKKKKTCFVLLPEKEILNPSYDIEKSEIKRNWALKFP